MPRNRFEKIKKFLHFNDNSTLPTPCEDRLFRLRPFFEIVRAKFLDLPFSKEMLSVDEQIIPYKGKSSLKQYVPNKPRKYGYKMFVLCDSTGIVHNFELYTGKILPANGHCDVGASGNIVLTLASAIPSNKNYKLYCDNWFTSAPLFYELAKKGVWALGTVRRNRLPGCSLKDDKALKSAGRGSFHEKTASHDGVPFHAVTWFDNRSVSFLSTFVATDPVEDVRRYDKKEHRHIEVPSPACVRIYNKYMGGVDLVDQMASFPDTFEIKKVVPQDLFFSSD
ncbi:piggyBac transposable element-derived protein 3-like [Ornithodoros turicata]|uniref:piggyBac transposable element-derived protein 3-like n=1 Tax=Ornithodoros turicata TaxID=34597 RepID=UPI003138D785